MNTIENKLKHDNENTLFNQPRLYKSFVSLKTLTTLLIFQHFSNFLLSPILFRPFHRPLLLQLLINVPKVTT